MFYVGQKVVCVDVSLGRFTGLPVPLRKGSIYTIRGVYDDPGGTPSVLLEGVGPGAPPHLNGLERGFQASRFRPIVKRKTSIEIFQRMLTPNREHERA